MIVQEQERKRREQELKQQQQQQLETPSLIINDSSSRPGSPTYVPRSRSSSRRPSSMLLDSNGGYGPEPSGAMFRNTSSSPSRSRPGGPIRTTSSSNVPIAPYSGGVSLTPQRSAPSINRSSINDPYLDGTSFYYKSSNLRPTISSTSARDSSVTREKEKGSSIFSFWKSGSSNNRSRSRSANRPGSISNGTARSPSVDREKLLLSQNAQAIASGFASLTANTPISSAPSSRAVRNPTQACYPRMTPTPFHDRTQVPDRRLHNLREMLPVSPQPLLPENHRRHQMIVVWLMTMMTGQVQTRMILLMIRPMMITRY